MLVHNKDRIGEKETIKQNLIPWVITKSINFSVYIKLICTYLYGAFVWNEDEIIKGSNECSLIDPFLCF